MISFKKKQLEIIQKIIFLHNFWLDEELYQQIYLNDNF